MRVDQCALPLTAHDRPADGDVLHGVIDGVSQSGLTRVTNPGNISRLKPLHLREHT